LSWGLTLDTDLICGLDGLLVLLGFIEAHKLPKQRVLLGRQRLAAWSSHDSRLLRVLLCAPPLMGAGCAALLLLWMVTAVG
jgi:hypothetical protein